MCELLVLNRAFLMRFSTKSPHILVCMGNNGNGQCPILFAFSAKRPCFWGETVGGRGTGTLVQNSPTKDISIS